jgi:spermidine/putrescine transport system permease protein
VSAAATAPRRGLSLRRRRQLWPLALLAPGVVALVILFAIPALNQLYVSLQTGSPEEGYVFSNHWGIYADAISRYNEQFVRSLMYAGLATLLAFVIGFPLAYVIAFRATRWRNFLLLLVILPFFTSYIVRTAAWTLILADEGPIVSVLTSLGLADGRVLQTTPAVIAGITYNFLPFMVLPLYVALERIDRRLIEAATDLYATRFEAFRRVTLPLAAPGILAGCMLVFIPAIGDYVNALLLGSSRQFMIGNVIQSQYLSIRDYPMAAALSFLLMVTILILVAAFTRALGTKALREAAAA